MADGSTRTQAEDRAVLARLGARPVAEVQAARRAFIETCVPLVLTGGSGAATIPLAERLEEVLEDMVTEVDEPFYGLRMVAAELVDAARAGQALAPHVAALRHRLASYYAERSDEGWKRWRGLRSTR